MRAEGFHIVHDLPALWSLLGWLVYDAERPIFAIGGEECYRLFLPYVHRAYVTRLAGTYEADVFLPSLTDFVRTGCRRREDCIFEIYERV